jgi:hypothetical protein
MGHNAYIHGNVTSKTPFIAILNKQKCHFFTFTKSENRMAEQALSGGLVSVGAERMCGKGRGR